MKTVLAPSIEYRMSGFLSTDHMHNFIGGLLAEAAKMGVEPGDLRKLVVTDDDSYGPAIRGFDPAAGYTDDGIYRGVGKIIAEHNDGEFVGSNLVVHHCLLGCFAAQPDSEHPADELEAIRYTFFHEMGHCIDHRRRQVQHTAPPPLTTNSVLKRCATLNSAVVLEEYAACFFSAAYMTPRGFAYMAKSTCDNLVTYLAKCADKRDRHRRWMGPLDAVRDAALTAYWRGLIEYAKLTALLHGNSGLGVALPGWPDGSPETATVLQKFAYGLVSAWSRYPDCDSEFERVATEAWYALTAAEGYRFEARSEGDHLRFA